MNQCPVAIRGAARLRLLWLCFGLLIISANANPPASLASAQTNDQKDGARTTSLPLKVCVSDDTGERVTVQPLLLNSTSNAADVIKQKTAEGCYASPPIKLKPGQVYFAAAMSEGRIAFSPFTVSLEDKEKSVNLTLSRKGSLSSSGIEICANDDGGNPLPITGITLLGGKAQLTKQQSVNPNCYRVSAVASNEYNLSLTTQSLKPSAALSNTALGILGALLLLANAAALGLIALFIIPRTLAPLTAQQATVQKMAQAVIDLSADTPVIKQKVEELIRRTPPAAVEQSIDDQSDKTDMSAQHYTATAPHAPNSAEHKTASTAATATPTTDTSQQHRNFDDAKLKYREFSKGQAIEHFYLMPSGSSTASGMVEDACVELREQSNGTYVGFRSTINECEAMIFPMPNAYFSSETFKALFPKLTQQEYESGSIEPRLAVNSHPKVWKVQ